LLDGSEHFEDGILLGGENCNTNLLKNPKVTIFNKTLDSIILKKKQEVIFY